MSAIVVVGSLNRDVVFTVDHLPLPGETIAALDRSHHWGGKGANQAVAAARLGGEVALIGAVGNDEVGEQYLRALAAESVNSDGIRRLDAATGEAFILVDQAGENSIVIDPGANGLLSTDHIRAMTQTLEGAELVLLQFEVPPATVAAAAEASRRVLLNPAPFRPIPSILLEAIDVLVPNETELAHLTGVQPDAPLSELEQAATALGISAVVTLGARGCLVVDGGTVTALPGHNVDVVDTTAAGDAFCGALAVALATGASLTEAARFANAAGAVATTAAGAQSSLPDRPSVEALLA